jgi:hypothetical protein
MITSLTISGRYLIQIKADELSRLRIYMAIISSFQANACTFPHIYHKQPPNSRPQKDNMKLVLYHRCRILQEPVNLIVIWHFLLFSHKEKTAIIMLKILGVYNYNMVPCINVLQLNP